MNRFRLHAPRFSANTVFFSWEVDPPSSLYWKNEFHLTFPDSIDLGQVPERVWGLVAMFCLHPHWVLLRPCRVELPFGLETGELELWYRLLDAAVATLEIHAGRTDFARTVEIVGCGAPFPATAPLPESNRCATAFSGGKDSLVQTGLLTELGYKPLLVATTSQLPPREDHLTERRRHVFNTIVKRRDVSFVEVESDFRAIVNYDFSHTEAHYAISVTELTDTFLFLSSLLAVSAARGVTHLFQASEAEVQESVEQEGRIVQHRHFMYSAVTQKAMACLIAPHGMHFCSLISPLYAALVHRLLWTRYRDLRDLQYSCWMVRKGEGTCSRCRDCLEYAFSILALRDRPARMGLELGKVLREGRDWVPRTIAPENLAPTPSQIASQRNSGHIMTNMRASSIGSFLWAMLVNHPRELLSASGREAIQCFRKLKLRIDPMAPASLPGYRPGFLDLVDPLVRDRIGAIYAQQFVPEPESQYADLLARSKRLAAWICDPIVDSSSRPK